MAKWTEATEKEGEYQPKDEYDNFVIKFEDLQGETSKNQEHIINRIMTLENFTEKYVPIRTQNSICDALKSVMPSKSIKKVKEYEDRVNKTIHEVVLNDHGIADLKGRKESILKTFSPSPTPKISRKGTNKYKQLETFNSGTGGKMMNKTNLISNYSTIVGKRYTTDVDLTGNLEAASLYDKSSRFRKSRITETVESGPDLQSNESYLRTKSKDMELENENDIKETISSRDDDAFNDILEKFDSNQRKIQVLEEKIDKFKSTDMECQKQNNEHVQQWRDRIEEYVNTLHFEIEEQVNLTKQFKLDVYERLKSQRKMSSELNSKMTALFSTF
eukprot:CAMPEP_0205802884 /NCGR_PEP_ID=MMETSP0205-20121125/5358_1 /ASSEMBLY_ACC=CAM_ASM_000278 /TAXON_ID=36767 /ORGANISM="Euplotes focardii, Strain TN1" /LENGTH=330 /DNA_ID=CAMNT_0053070049 /DNA_START=594 /DNA_END=1583 /DNA_ORIENTATION=+